MHHRRRTRILLLAALVAAVVVPPALAAAPGAKGPVGPGCDPDRPAVAHRAGGVVLAPQPSGAPVPCATVTGYGGAETRVAVTADGAAVYEPAVITPGVLGQGYLPGAPGPRAQVQTSPSGLAVSRDAGASWRFVEPEGMTWEAQDDQLYVDRTTGRVFWYAMNPNPVPQGGGVAPSEQLPLEEAHLMVSPDDGATWHHSSACCPAASENPRFATAVAPAGQPRPADYPDVAYFCADTTVGFTSPVIAGRVCSRSLDGGLTWHQRSILFTSAVPRHSECGASGESFSATDGDYPEAAPDGSLYVMVSCGGRTFLARSTDEGGSWPILRTASGAPLQLPAADELRVDTAGNLYAVALANGRLLLRTSTDGGYHWSRALDVTAPGVATVGEWFVAVRGPGAVALSYYGQRPGGSASDGWITATRDALEPDPVFWSATVNDPRAPLVAGRPQVGGQDFIGADIGPDGTAWGSYFADCPPGAADPACSDGGSPVYGGTRAVAGRLVWPGAGRPPGG